jgi:hypothetical protein
MTCESWTRRIAIGVLTTAFWLLAMNPAQAASGDADGTYTVTITKLELSTDGTTFVTVFEGSQAINIASANAGAVAAGLVSGVTLALHHRARHPRREPAGQGLCQQRGGYRVHQQFGERLNDEQRGEQHPGH